VSKLFPDLLEPMEATMTGKQHTVTSADGSKYVGEFKNDYMHGQGTYTYANGDKYVGEYRDGKKHGQGTETDADGGKYVGEWKNGKAHGKGTETDADGGKYVGEWKDGEPYGKGTETDADGRKKEEDLTVFGFGKNREQKLIKEMHTYADVATMAVFCYVTAIDEDGDNEGAPFVAAMVNYLFGKVPDPEHLEMFGSEKVESEATKLIENNVKLKELVVQSLRVLAAVDPDNFDGLALLGEYGSEFPAAPDPDSFPEVIKNFVQSMPEAAKSEFGSIEVMKERLKH
jgi:hypothetical protein